jgi:hypothetical protein
MRPPHALRSRNRSLFSTATPFTIISPACGHCGHTVGWSEDALACLLFASRTTSQVPHLKQRP